MSDSTSFYDAPVGELAEQDVDSLLNNPFLIARVVGFEGEDTPLFEIAFGAGMQKEDVPLVVEMLYELFLPEIEARYAAERAVNEQPAG